MIGTLSDIERAARSGLDALDKWERETCVDSVTGESLTPWDQWLAACARRMQYATGPHRTHRNRPLDISAPWLRAIYEDAHRDLVIRKSVKCGISEYLVVREIAEAAVGRQVIHVLPDHTLRPRFVAERIDKPLAFVPEYRELCQIALGSADNRSFKMIGDGIVHYVGSNTPTPFTEVVGDTAIVDELDRCNLENLELLQDRLTAEGTVQAWVRVANPTHADFGISKLYADSDRGEWRVRCEHCGARQCVDWFLHVVEVERDDEGNITAHRVRDPKFTEGGELRAICATCSKPFDRLGPGRWTFGQPGAPARGYHLSKLMTRQATLAELYGVFVAALDDATKMARFVNNDLGLPYSPPGSCLNDALLNACRREFGVVHQAAGPCTMGVDVGSVLDIRVSDSPEPEVRRCRWIGRAPLRVDEAIGRLRAYNVRSCVIDAQPETHFCREILRELGRDATRRHGVWLCQFSGGFDPKDPHRDAKARIVKVDRTQIFDAATARIRQRRNWLPRNAQDLLGGEYYRQMEAPKRVVQESPDGDVRNVWTKGEDHQRLADVYDELAYRLGGSQLAAVSGRMCARLSAAQRRTMARTR